MSIYSKEINGFKSLGEYNNFLQHIEAYIDSGDVKEIITDPEYENGMLYGGRWFHIIETDEIWRLIEPDNPFKGIWEPVKR